MQNQNIVLDFTVNASIGAMLAGQPVAMMPAELAKKLLRDYARKLVNASDADIIADHVREIRVCITVDEAINVSTSWLQERELIQNIGSENPNWNAYETIPANPHEDESPKTVSRINLRKDFNPIQYTND